MAHLHETLHQRIKPGDLLEGRYRLGHSIGAGAYGLIFSAIDEDTGERVAIKSIPPVASGTSHTALGRFQREMKVIRALLHPNIVALYDWGEAPDQSVFMVLEYIEGQTLDAVVRDNPLEVQEAIEVTRQIAMALDCAHSSAVIHRDLKPANVMLVGDRLRGYRAKILDFGMAKVLARRGDEPVQDLTREGMAVGTPRYIAPEQARGQLVGPPADIYALGLLFYEMLTGQQAVKADTVEAAVSAHVSSRPLELAEIDLIDANVHPVLFKMLEKDPARRFQNCGELVSALNRLEHMLSSGSILGTNAHIGVALGAKTGDFLGIGVAAAPATRDPALVREEEHRQEVFERLAAAGPVKLELDYDAYRQHAPADRDPVAVKRRAARGRWFRLPRRGSEWAEVAMGLVLGPAGFVLITAQMPQFDDTLRLAVGATATFAALVWSVLAHTDDWRLSFWRLWWALSLVVIVLAHLLGPQSLVTELLRNPTWFMTAVADVPGTPLVEAAVQWAAKQYAGLLNQTLVPLVTSE